MAVLVAYLVNLTIPRAGEVFRATVMTTYEDIPFEKGFGTIVAERIADLIMMLLILGITLFVQFDFIFELLTKNFSPTKILLLLGALVIGLFHFCPICKESERWSWVKDQKFCIRAYRRCHEYFQNER